jgi:hypothetical protein
MYKNHPLNLDVTDIFELVTKVAQKRNHHVPHETSELVIGKALTHTAHPLFFFIINMNDQTMQLARTSTNSMDPLRFIKLELIIFKKQT